MPSSSTPHPLPLDYRSERVLLGRGSSFVAHPDCVVLTTPHNPHYFWGNCLLAYAPPQAGSRSDWLERFQTLVADAVPGIRHIAIGWVGGPLADQTDWEAPHWEFFSAQVMSLRTLRQPTHGAPANVMAQATDDDWDQILEMEVLTREAERSEAGYRRYMVQQIAHWRALIDAHQGRWFVCRIDAQVVASCGVFFEREPGADGRTLGRFQRVTTHPDFRRQGLCAALIHHAAAWTQSAHALDELVIVADIGAGANRVYAQVGFEDRYLRYGAQWAVG